MMIRSVMALAAAAALLAVLASCKLELNYDKYAIVYGISDYPPAGYDSNSNDLEYPDDDARDVAALLTSQGFQVVLRVTDHGTGDKDANRAQLIADFDEAATTANLGQDDLFVFYYSGHGDQVPQTAGSSEDSPDSDAYDESLILVDETVADIISLNDDELAALLRTIPCVRKVVVIDACNSGGFIANAAEADAIQPDYTYGSDGLFATLADAIHLYANFQDYGSDIPPEEALVIAASGERESSFDGYYEHGVMTYFFLESASRGDRNRDGYVTVSESYNYVYRKIQANWNNTWYGLSYDVFFPRVSGGPVDYILFVD
ncbi:MAG: caspase family protein [Spirochaetales bacterium]|nr:caspase family protein [Spirochaetales bacterium]